MVVKSGYKKTEVGIIPEDWIVDTLTSTTPMNLKNAIVDGPFGSNLKTIHYRKSGIPIITSGYVTDGYFHAERYIFVDHEKFKQEKRSKVDPGDIVMAKIGARCGASAILPEWHQTGILSGNALKITIDNCRHSTYYIWQVLWNLYNQGIIETLRTTGAQPAISMATLKKYKIPLPPLPEQNTIAAALSDADSLITSLEKLIAKKKAIKQGAMQQLLTGKRRLPGFTGEWAVKKLQSIVEIKSGGTPSTKILEYWGGSILWCTPTDITRLHSNKYLFDTEKKITDVGLAKSSAGILPANSIIMTSRATIGECAINKIPISTNQGFKSLIPKAVNTEFLYYKMLTQKKRLEQLGNGSTFFEVSKKDVGNLIIDLPQTLDEQHAIAQLLSDMDVEIEALENKLEKTRLIKQGMMQELLTGRKRLI